MIGTIVNTACIIAGSLLGATLKRGIKPQYQTALYNAMGLCAFVLGVNACVQNLPKSDYPVLFVVSLAVGSLVGYMLRLSEKFSFNPDYISRSIKKYTGLSFKQLTMYYRLNKVANDLIHTEEPIITIAQRHGFSNMNFFYDKFKDQYQCPPTEFREKNK